MKDKEASEPGENGAALHPPPRAQQPHRARPEQRGALDVGRLRVPLRGENRTATPACLLGSRRRRAFPVAGVGGVGRVR